MPTLELGVHGQVYPCRVHLARSPARVSSQAKFNLLSFVPVSTDKELTTRVSVENDSGIESNRESLEISRNHRPSFI